VGTALGVVCAGVSGLEQAASRKTTTEQATTQKNRENIAALPELLGKKWRGRHRSSHESKEHRRLQT
jgi:hypothetical protein